MMAKTNLKNRVGKAIFGLVFGIISIFSGFAPMIMGATPVYAEPEDVVEALENGEISEEELEGALEEVENEADGDTTADDKAVKEKNCKESLGSLGWLICPATGTIAKAVDWLYEKIEDVLVINPVEIKDGSPIYEVWKYIKGITNILFIIFLLVMVYSQITGLGITNYGLKKTLPKLIVGAILVNLSFVMCSLAVDASNIIGGSLRGVFTTIEESTMQTMAENGTLHLSMSDMYSSLAAGTAFAGVAGVVAFETGAIWMMIPTALGAIVAVVVGLITIALRQAVVAILIMIAPMAIVAYILPNTGKWFQQWKQLLIRMLVFYPAFSLLFGASSLAGWALITSAKDGFWLLLGVAVQIFPLFFSWKLMSMSGTFLSNINAKLRAIAAKPLATNRVWAESHRDLTRQRMLASKNAYTPSLKLAQFLSNRQIARGEEIAEHATTVKNRGLAYSAKRNYKRGDLYGAPSKAGEEAYEAQARNAVYQQEILRHKNNMNKGFGYLAKEGTAQRARLDWLDDYTVQSFDRLKMEQARTEKIDYDNAVGFHKRMEDAMNAHFDEINWNKRDDKGNLVYKRHFKAQDAKPYLDGLARYNDAAKIMEGNVVDTQYTAAFAAHAYDTQAKIIMTKFQKYFELTPPTRDVRYRLEELSKYQDALNQYMEAKEKGVAIDPTKRIRATDNIDAIISGMRILNQRGDTDFVKDVLDDLTDERYGGLELGTHASQALASFLMFDVKDSDPWLRRFGKYINLETAAIYDKNKRQKMTVDYDEYVRGYYYEPGDPHDDAHKKFPKKDMTKLMEGTSLDGIERTAMDNYRNSVMKAYTDENGKVDYDGYLAKMSEVETATLPQFISANMKFLSGSEQITSSVKEKSGYVALQDDKTGKYSMVPIWEVEKEADKLFAGMTPEERDKAKKGLADWYRDNFIQYVKGQTPAQILGFRSDYEKPLVDHMFEAYFWSDDGKEELLDRRQKYDEQIAAINGKNYGLTDSAEIDARRKKEKDALKKYYAGEQFREILYQKGKLEQIKKSKRSGAANNAKDWLRSLLLLDTDSGLDAWIINRQSRDKRSGGSGPKGGGPKGGGDVPPSGGGPSGGEPRGGGPVGPAPTMPSAEELSALRQQRVNETIVAEQARIKQAQETTMRAQWSEEQQKQILREIEEQQRVVEADASLALEEPSLSLYTVEQVAGFRSQIEDMWYDMRDSDNDYDEFYEASHDFAVANFGAESYVAVAYEKYYEENPNGDSYNLREYLMELLKTLLDD